MTKKIKMFYLLNYKGIHHIINLFNFLVFFYFLDIHHLLIPGEGPIIFQFFILLINYRWTEFTIKLIKFDEIVEDEIDKMNEHKKTHK
jgi:hypothetical protein